MNATAPSTSSTVLPAVAAIDVPPRRLLVVLAFAAIYLIWGSTYLAIAVAVDGLPPFLLAGARYVVAGSILAAIAFARGASLRAVHPGSIVVGLLMVVGGNGLVTWSEQSVPSGLAALLIATVPLWVTTIQSLVDRVWPTRVVVLGLTLGLAGVAVLSAPGLSGALPALGIGALLLSALSWSTGTMLSRRLVRGQDPFAAASLQMLSGGVALLGLALATGEGSGFTISQVPPRAILALAYLTIFGSVVAHSAYTWLLTVAPPSRVATYAYVNPVVAVLLGWGFRGEELAPRTLLGAAVIVAAVFMVTSSATRERDPKLASRKEG